MHSFSLEYTVDFRKPIAWALGATTPWFVTLGLVIVWIQQTGQ